MIWLVVFYFLCSLSCFAYNPFELHGKEHLGGWPERVPPSQFTPIPGSGSPPFHMPSLQSPIDIKTRDTTKVWLPNLEFLNLLDPDVQVVVENTGYTVELHIASESVMKPRIYGGPLATHGPFEFSNIHLHWGFLDVLGGEHKINSRRFAIEGHCVHFNLKYGTIEEASTHPDGLAVVGFFAKVGNRDNPDFEKLVRLLPGIRYPNTSMIVPASEGLAWLGKIAEPINYFTYPGSLTTPPYTENVFWMVYPRPMHVSHRQVDALRTLLDDNLQRNKENSRPIQKFNDRPLLYTV